MPRENLTPRRDLEAQYESLKVLVEQLKATNEMLERKHRIAIQENQAMATRIAQLQAQQASR